MRRLKVSPCPVVFSAGMASQGSFITPLPKQVGSVVLSANLAEPAGSLPQHEPVGLSGGRGRLCSTSCESRRATGCKHLRKPRPWQHRLVVSAAPRCLSACWRWVPYVPCSQLGLEPASSTCPACSPAGYFAHLPRPSTLACSGAVVVAFPFDPGRESGGLGMPFHVPPGEGVLGLVCPFEGLHRVWVCRSPQCSTSAAKWAVQGGWKGLQVSAHWFCVAKCWQPSHPLGLVAAPSCLPQLLPVPVPWSPVLP